MVSVLWWAKHVTKKKVQTRVFSNVADIYEFNRFSSRLEEARPLGQFSPDNLSQVKELRVRLLSFVFFTKGHGWISWVDKKRGHDPQICVSMS